MLTNSVVVLAHSIVVLTNSVIVLMISTEEAFSPPSSRCVCLGRGATVGQNVSLDPAGIMFLTIGR